MGAYGFSIEHILMVDIIPDPAVRKAMNEINAGNLNFSCSLFFLIIIIITGHAFSLQHIVEAFRTQ